MATLLFKMLYIHIPSSPEDLDCILIDVVRGVSYQIIFSM